MQGGLIKWEKDKELRKHRHKRMKDFYLSLDQTQKHMEGGLIKWERDK
jgi:hypothetical protein